MEPQIESGSNNAATPQGGPALQGSSSVLCRAFEHLFPGSRPSRSNGGNTQKLRPALDKVRGSPAWACGCPPNTRPGPATVTRAPREGVHLSDEAQGPTNATSKCTGQGRTTGNALCPASDHCPPPAPAFHPPQPGQISLPLAPGGSRRDGRELARLPSSQALGRRREVGQGLLLGPPRAAAGQRGK